MKGSRQPQHNMLLLLGALSGTAEYDKFTTHYRRLKAVIGAVQTRPGTVEFESAVISRKSMIQ